MLLAKCVSVTGMAANSQNSTILSVREREVLTAVRDRPTSADAADDLQCSKRTVDCHLQNIYCKLGVRCKKDAIMAAEDAGEIPARTPKR